MIWLDTKTQAEVSERRSRIWGTVWTGTEGGGMTGKPGGEGLSEGDQFWADAIKNTHDDPAARLVMAKRNLPLPAAFREAAIALRAMIRAKKKAGEDFGDELRELHRWAAIQSIATYDQLDVTPFLKIEALDLEPITLGWDELAVLNQTDRKQMAERWPTPSQHTTGAALYPKIRDGGQKQLARQRKADIARSMEQFAAMAAGEQKVTPQMLPTPLPSSQSAELAAPKRGFLARLFGR
jgi:hypothetical protein